MYYVIYHKQTKKVAEMRHDGSTHKLPTATWLQIFAKNNECLESDYACVEIVAQEVAFQAGNHVFNETTGMVEEDPTYVHPAPLTSTQETTA